MRNRRYYGKEMSISCSSCVFININASVFQGSGFGPAAFTVNTSDLKTLYSHNLLSKYADDTYLIVGSSRRDKLDHVSNWAASNNLRLNPRKRKYDSQPKQNAYIERVK